MPIIRKRIKRDWEGDGFENPVFFALSSEDLALCPSESDSRMIDSDLVWEASYTVPTYVPSNVVIQVEESNHRGTSRAVIAVTSD